ncbi:hypothetical protein SteCoe_3618 [Stentor coeruleus]|uniref:Uncharacterized protein n=1 Tax=Stentor coeruleus TaxID=5963 RepID=A0A1R2CWJ3_9CILI|nr:hypothetical protein SteCoe_3618 [Stentor coeruleus]
MSTQKFGRISPFRGPLVREDIGVVRTPAKNLDQLLLDAENIGSTLMQRSNKASDSPKRQFIVEKAMQRAGFQETPPLGGRYEDQDELEQKRLKHIEALTEELNLNRKRYEKLISDHAEEKRQWMNYIKQLEGEREREKMSPI